MAILLLILFAPILLVILLVGPKALGPILGLLIGLPAFGLVMLASGADNHGFAVGIIFAIVCWFTWVFRKYLRS